MTPANKEKVLLPDDFKIEYEPLVLGNEPVEDEAALRQRLFKPLKKKASAKEMARGQKKPELIVLLEGDEEEEEEEEENEEDEEEEELPPPAAKTKTKTKKRVAPADKGVAPQTATKKQKTSKKTSK